MRIPFALVAAVLGFGAAAPAQDTPPVDPSARDGLVVQKARERSLQTLSVQRKYAADRWDLSSLPAYQPQRRVSGAIRLWGNNYIADSGLGRRWQEDFQRYHPGARLDMSGLKSALIATAGLVSGEADIAANRHITFAELEGFERQFNHDPLEIAMARGSYDQPGWMTTFCIFVHRDNPLKGLTLRQLDGIFGTARDGGWVGTSWHPENGRGAEGDLRTWGQLGLKGEWAGKPIHVYGLNLRYNNCDMFERTVFQGGDKWNEHLREYANYSRPDGTLAIAANVLMGDLGRDRYGIGWSGIQNRTPLTRPLPIAARDDGPFVPLTLDTVHDRSYPLAMDMYFYVNKAPGEPLPAAVREFLRYVLSREGQREVARDGKYLPLTAEVVAAERRKLEVAP